MTHTPEVPTGNLAIGLIRVTEAAALAAGRHVGRGNKNQADGVAVAAMRSVLNTMNMDGIVVIGEGEKDNAPMLFNGEELGNKGGGPTVDIAVDPIDGTTLTANGLPNAIAVIALSERGSMFNPGPIVYMNKIATGPDAAHVIDIEASVKENLQAVAKAKNTDVDELTVVVLNRPRHSGLIDDIRDSGARIKLISDGDVAGAIATARKGSGVDVLMGIGGTPEAVIAAAALKCLGGELVGKLHPRDDEEKVQASALGYDLNQILTTANLVGDDIYFAATGITDGDLLQGVRYEQNGAKTFSLSMRGHTGTVRTIVGEHNLNKLNLISAIRY